MSKKKITIVEDERIIALDIKRALVKYGFNVNAVYGDAESLLQNIQNDIPDLIIMDIHLSGNMSGIEAASQVHKKYDVPVIFSTAYSDDVTLKKALKDKPFAYILKPFTDETLFTTVNVVFSRVEVEKQLKQAKERFKNLTDLLPLIVFEIDKNAKFTFLNSYAMNYLNITANEASFLDFLTDKQVFLNFLNRILSLKTSQKIKLHIKVKDKGDIPVFVIADLIKQDKKVIGYRGVAIDFTDIEKIQSQLLELERFSALSSIIAKFKTELSRYLSESYNILSELNVKDKSNKVDLEFVKNTMTNALRVMDNLEFFDINKEEIKFTEGNLNELILDISRMLIYILREKNIKFSCNCNHQLPKLLFDDKIIRTSVLILTNIALELLNKYSGTVILATDYSKDKKACVIITVVVQENILSEDINEKTELNLVKNILSYHNSKLMVDVAEKKIIFKVVV